jgi:hypothetical protein
MPSLQMGLLTPEAMAALVQQSVRLHMRDTPRVHKLAVKQQHTYIYS